MPYKPALPVSAIKVCELSTSEINSLPLAFNGALVSSKEVVTVDSTAASLVPVIATLMELVVPSAALTVKFSLYVRPSTIWLFAPAVYVQLPSSAMLKLP